MLKKLIFGLAVTFVAIGSTFAKQPIKMATVAPGTSIHLTMTTFASIVNQHQQDFEIVVSDKGPGSKHMMEVGLGKLDMSMMAPAVYNFMQKGTRMYAKAKKAPELAKNLRLLFLFPLGSIHFVTHADSGITRMEDIKERSIFIGPPGSGLWTVSQDIVKAVTGYQPKTDYNAIRASRSTAFQKFQNREIDVFVQDCIVPCQNFIELAANVPIRILGASEANKDLLKKALVPGRTLEVIEAGVYGDNQKNEVNTHTTGAILGVAVRHDLEENAVYQILKTFWENKSLEQKNRPWLKDITLEKAIQANPMKLHPGALKYYEEKGLSIPNSIRP